MDLGAILTTCLIGLVVGVIAKLLMPGRDPGGCIITILLGIAGAWLGTFLGRLFFGGSYAAGWIMSIIGAMLLLLIYRMILGKRS
ncbi:MAG: GlsB/YeaQ/YmgE family stress response membrane protein [Chthoniobacterales bacterium]